jgi:predicted transcriptional regulator
MTEVQMPREVLTLRIPSQTLAQLEQVARHRGETRTEVLLAAIEDLVSRDANVRAARLEEARARLRAAAEEQSAFLDRASVSDEWRTF